MVRRMSTVLLLRFPDGDVEYRSTLTDVVEGTRVRARGTSWRVRSINGLTVTLEAIDTVAPDGASAGPVVIPDPLGDKPLTLEILAEA
jgi:hypothetical protein